jgi:hypothetical protein
VQDRCEEIRELIAAYAVGAADAAEAQQVRDALADCPEVAEELADYVALLDTMNHSLPLRHPAPPAARILAGITDGAPARPTPRPRQPAPPPQPQSLPAPRRARWWWSAAALLLVTLLALGSNWLWWREVDNLRQTQAALLDQLNARPTPQSPFALVLNPEDSHQRVLLPTDAGQDGALARVIWNSEFEVGSLFVTGLQVLPPDMAYQLWAVRDGAATSLGQFQVDDTGTGILIFQSPEPIVSFEALGISPEPITGSSAPTHDHVVVGRI